MLSRNWLLRKRICEEELLGDNNENYGKQIVKRLSESLTHEFGTGFSERNLHSFIRFYKMFPYILQTLSAKSSILTWPRYQELMRVIDDDARAWYLKQSVEDGWSVRPSEGVLRQVLRIDAVNFDDANHDICMGRMDVRTHTVRPMHRVNPKYSERLIRSRTAVPRDRRRLPEWDGEMENG